MYRILMSLERIITRTVEALLAAMFMAIFIMVFYQVVLRYGFRTAILGTAEVYTILFAYSSALGAAIMVRYREHIKITVFIDLLPTSVRRWIYLLNYTLIATFSWFIVRESIPWLRSIHTFLSPVTGIPRSVRSVAIPIGFGLIILYCAVNALSLFLSPEEAEEEYSSSDAEARQALEEAAEADARYRELHGDEEEDR